MARIVSLCELAERRLRTIAEAYRAAADLLDSDQEIDDASVDALLAVADRGHRAIADVADTDGARREWVIRTLDVLAVLLARFPDDDAMATWLGLQSFEAEPDGPFPDLTEAFVDEANAAAVLSAARALAAPKTAGRARGRGSAYAPIATLLSRLPDGAGSSLEISSLVALRKLVERSRK